MGSHSVTCHPTQVNAPRLNPSHAGWYSIYLPQRDGRLSWPSWLDSAPAGSLTSDLSITSPTLNCCTTNTTKSSASSKQKCMDAGVGEGKGRRIIKISQDLISHHLKSFTSRRTGLGRGRTHVADPSPEGFTAQRREQISKRCFLKKRDNGTIWNCF